jgi:diphthamide synthase (EF-2-diphthine--ammonia ligase)
MIGAAGIRALITRVDPRVLDAGWAGRFFGDDFIAALGPGVDPCGENGEFHTFTCDSPDFACPVPASLERIVRRDGSVYAELADAACQAGDGRRPA